MRVNLAVLRAGQQQVFADIVFADSAAAASRTNDLLSARELLELGKTDVQQMVEQFVTQTQGDALANVDAQVVVDGVEACAEHGRGHHAGEEEAGQAHVGCGYGDVDERQRDEERYSGNLLSQFLLEESEGGVRRFVT